MHAINLIHDNDHGLFQLSNSQCVTFGISAKLRSFVDNNVWHVVLMRLEPNEKNRAKFLSFTNEFRFEISRWAVLWRRCNDTNVCVD